MWVLCRKSNPGAADPQDVASGSTAQPLYARVAAMVCEATTRADTGLVVGATSARSLTAVREVAPEPPLLVLGVSAQGGNLEAAVRAAATGPVVISVSHSVLYGDAGSDAAAIRHRAVALRSQLNVLLADSQLATS